MPTKRESPLVECRYFNWLLSKRNGVWRADGRSNKIDAGRRSLNTRSIEQAKKLVHELDEHMAMKLGLIERKAPSAKFGISIPQAIKKFREHKGRPVSVGGVEPETLKRYNRILNKFEAFVAKNNIQYVTEIGHEVFDDYVSLLEEMDFALSTIVTEMVQLNSVHQFCIDEKLLDAGFAFKYPLKRPTVSLTYCPSNQEVAEVLRISQCDESLTWLHRVVSVLSMTGLRFGEARDIEWRDIDKDFTLLHVRDESYLRSSGDKKVRKTSTRRSRKIPIHKELAKLLRTFRKKSGQVLTGPREGSLRNDLFGDTLRNQVIPPVIEVEGNEDAGRLTAHGFRHFFVSKCANSGVPQLSVMNWLGHRTARMTNYYYHTNEAASLKHMRQLEAAEESGHRDQIQ